MQIDTVVFDLGQVLVRWDPRRVWRDRVPEHQIDEFLERDFARLNAQLDGGRTFDSAILELAEHSPAYAAMLRMYRDDFAQALDGPVPGTAEIVAALHGAGIRLLGLTNWSAETFAHAAPAAPAIGWLEQILVSGEVELTKPDPAIFALLVSRFALTPETTIFVDDSARNVAAASGSGLQAIRFESAAQLRDDLRRWGLETE